MDMTKQSQKFPEIDLLGAINQVANSLAVEP